MENERLLTLFVKRLDDLSAKVVALNAAFKVFTKGMEEETQKLKEILKKEDILTEQEREDV